MPTDPILYSFRRCPFAMRARMALAVSGVRCEWREVKLGTKPSSMLAVSSKGTVPILVAPNGEVIDESLDIMRWALAKSDPEDWLARDDPALIEATDVAFKRDLDRYKYPQRHDCDPITHRASGMAFLREVDARLAVGGHLGGSKRGFADAAIMPFVRQFAAVDQGWFDRQSLKPVQTWLNGYLASDLFKDVMVRVTPWSPNDGPIYFPPGT